MRAACVHVGVEEVLGTEQSLDLFGLRIELNPLLIYRLRDTAGGDPG